jgi:predicted outer membrane repeat protein
MIAAIGTWQALKSSVAGAAGKSVVLTLSAPFSMTGYTPIEVTGATTSITIIGNGAVFDAAKRGRFFHLDKNATLVVANVTLKNGYRELDTGGAMLVAGGAKLTLTSCVLSKNYAFGGGAIYVAGATVVLTLCTLSDNYVGIPSRGGAGGAMFIDAGGTATLTSCTFNENLDSYYNSGGGALFIVKNAEVLLRGCNFQSPILGSENDIARNDASANVTFACPDGLSGAAVQMEGNEITVIPPQALHCSTSYKCVNNQCVMGAVGVNKSICARVCY